MRRALAVLSCMLVLAAGCTDRSADEVAAIRRFVEAWPVGGSTLAATVTGPESSRLVRALGAIVGAGITGVRLAEVSSAGDGSRQATVALDFADGGELRVTIRVTVAGSRIRSEPTAVSASLIRWEDLHLVSFGDPPSRGDILSRHRTVLATGPRGDRSVTRRALLPAISLIDQALNARLAGHVGRRLVAEPSGRVLAESPWADGEDVVTSLDDSMQVAAERSLGAYPGALVALDPRTGGIRALVSNPERQAPDVSPATSAYSPGSTFKIVTAAAALENHILAPNDIVPCPARLLEGERQITNFGGLEYGPITFERAFAVSCNTAFSQIGVAVGTIRLLRTAQRLGFRVGELTGPGTIAVPSSRGELAVWSFGAGGSLVSPLLMATIGSAVARGGTWLPAGWADRSDPGRRVLQPTTATTLLDMMEDVVTAGTGKNAAIPGVRIAGKTGTADPRRPGARSDAWFVGLAPSRGTHVVVAAFLPGAGIGGDEAALLAHKFFLALSAAGEL